MHLITADVNLEYEKNKQLKKNDIRALQEWCEKQPHLPVLSELQLILFLQSCYFSIERAKLTIDTFYTVRTHFPDIFSSRDPCSLALKQAMDVCLYAPIPKCTPEGYRILYCKILDQPCAKYDCIDNLKLFDMNMMLWLMQEGTAEGFVMIVDMQHVKFGHTTKANIMGLKKFFYYIQEGIPLRLRSVHFINVVSFMDKVMAILRPFMKKELLDMHHFHSESIETLYKYVPKECLPKDFGGTADSVISLQESMKKRLMENAIYFKSEEQHVADESKRPGKPKNTGDIFGVEGTFKKLDID